MKTNAISRSNVTIYFRKIMSIKCLKFPYFIFVSDAINKFIKSEDDPHWNSGGAKEGATENRANLRVVGVDVLRDEIFEFR